MIETWCKAMQNDGIVTAITGNRILVYSYGSQYNAAMRGRLLKDFQDISPIAVGDKVKIQFVNDKKVVIEEVMPRENMLSRTDILGRDRIQVIASNIDQIVIISSVAQPDFKPGIVDRFLVGSEIAGISAAIVINKLDLKSRERVAPFLDGWEVAGYKTVATSAKTDSGIDDFKNLLFNNVSVLVGHSGVGKSTLINRIEPSLNIKSKMVSKSTGKGVHTTTSVIMHKIADTTWIIDTPGLKLFDYSRLKKENLWNYFPDLVNFASNCKFNDCRHISEPDCAIKQALAENKLSQFRYESYLRIYNSITESDKSF